MSVVEQWSSRPPAEERVGLYAEVSREQIEKLHAVARKNERSMAAELRYRLARLDCEGEADG